MRDNLASLMSGVWLLLQFAKELCDFSEGDITRLKSATLNAANKVAELQITADKEASDADRFIELLRSSHYGCCAFGKRTRWPPKGFL